ncbi:MAG: M14 metallopeptidase family protein [Acidobacteriota bacterium]
MKTLFYILLVMTTVFTVNLPAYADSFTFYPDAKYRSDIPKPEDVIGHSVGEHFTHYSDIVGYYRRLAEVSSNLKIIEYGRTYERRKLHLLIISSIENLAALDRIKAETARLGDPRRVSEAEMERTIAQLPATVWLSYNVHGDESSSSEAALQVVYHLLADQSEETTRLLKELVIVIDPLVNPDGRERYVSFYEQAQGRSAKMDSNAFEHHQRWPGGRFNHYLFDLNRDWAWMTQAESQARIRVFREWQPQVHVDYHEASPESTYFFPPAAKPVNANIPALMLDWLKIFGKGNGSMFDRFGLGFYTSEDFDLYYPGYGDSWPSLNGAVGMTYEQAGGGRAGLALRLEQRQSVLTLRERAWHHFLTSLSTLKTAADNRQARLRDYYRFRAQAIEAGKRGPMRAFVLLPGRDPGRAAKLAALLIDQGIEVAQARTAFRVRRAHSYFNKDVAQEKEFPAGSYIINLAQPTGFLAKGLLEPEAVLKDLFFYDVTGWSLPLAYNVESYWLEDNVEAQAEKLASAPIIKGEVVGGRASYAYVFSYETNGAARTLCHLLQEDYEAFLALKPFTLAGRQFPLGAIIVPVQKNSATLHERIAALVASNGHEVVAAATARSEDGIDLGSNRVRFIRKPKVAVVMGPGVSVTDYGSIWFLLDERYGLAFTPISTDQLAGVDLREYNTLIFPDDQDSGKLYQGLFSKSTVEKINRWVREGGTFIGIKGGAVFATTKQSGLTSITYQFLGKRDEEERIEREKSQDKDSSKESSSTPPAANAPSAAASKKPEEELAEKLLPYSEKEKRRMAETIPGTLMRIKLDHSHPLGLGYESEIAVLNFSSPILSLTAKGDNVAYYPKEQFKLSGFLTPEHEKKVAHSGYLIKERAGRGSFILYADDPNFRSFWEGTTRLFLNGILFGAIVDPNVE